MPRTDEHSKEEKKTLPKGHVELSRPLMTHKGELSILKFREINAADMVEMRVAPIAQSFLRTGKGDGAVIETKVEVRYDMMMTLAGRLGEGVDELILKSLPARDFNKIVDVLSDLWRDAEGE